MSYLRIIRAAECVTNEIEIYREHKKLC